MVFPKPISSASMVFVPWDQENRSQFSPSSWYGCSLPPLIAKYSGCSSSFFRSWDFLGASNRLDSRSSFSFCFLCSNRTTSHHFGSQWSCLTGIRDAISNPTKGSCVYDDSHSDWRGCTWWTTVWQSLPLLASDKFGVLAPGNCQYQGQGPRWDEEFHGHKSNHLEQFTSHPVNRNSLPTDVHSISEGLYSVHPHCSF